MMGYLACRLTESVRTRAGQYIRYFRWVCPQCTARNRSRVPPLVRVKQARCGVCHAGYWIADLDLVEQMGQGRLFPEGSAPARPGTQGALVPAPDAASGPSQPES